MKIKFTDTKTGATYTATDRRHCRDATDQIAFDLAHEKNGTIQLGSVCAEIISEPMSMQQQAALAEIEAIQRRMWKTLRRLTPQEAIAEDLPDVTQAFDEAAIEDTAMLWVDVQTEWWVAEQKNGKFSTIAFDEDAEHDSITAAFEWLRERFSW